jgi:hypothetical protein
MFKYLYTALFGSSLVNEPVPNRAGPDYRPPFTVANQACYGEIRRIADTPSQQMAVVMIKSKKDHAAIDFARKDLQAYSGLVGDYVFYGNFEANYIRY